MSRQARQNPLPVIAAVAVAGMGLASAIAPHVGKKKDRAEDAAQRIHEQQLAQQQLYLSQVQAQAQAQRTQVVTRTALYVGLALTGGIIIYALARD